MDDPAKTPGYAKDGRRTGNQSYSQTFHNINPSVRAKQNKKLYQYGRNLKKLKTKEKLKLNQKWKQKGGRPTSEINIGRSPLRKQTTDRPKPKAFNNRQNIKINQISIEDYSKEKDDELENKKSKNEGIAKEELKY